MEMKANVCKCPHHKIIPALAVLFGLDFLAGALGWLPDEAVIIIWPIIIIIGGLSKMVNCTCCAQH